MRWIPLPPKPLKLKGGLQYKGNVVRKRVNYQVNYLSGTNTHNPSISSKHPKKSSNEILGFLLPVFQLVLHSVSQLAHLLTNMHLFLLRGEGERERGEGRRKREKEREVEEKIKRREGDSTELIQEVELPEQLWDKLFFLP